MQRESDRTLSARARGRFIGFLICTGCFLVIAKPDWNAKAESILGIAKLFSEPNAALSKPATHSSKSAASQLSTSASIDPIRVDLARKIINYAKSKGWVVRSGARRYNIFYIQGMDLDGKLNKQRFNAFDDLRVVVEDIDNTPRIVGMWEATTKAGLYYYKNPLNPKGTARIVPGQYRSWLDGYHKGNPHHPALVQTAATILVNRQGYGMDRGFFGVNQHGVIGKDLPKDNVWNASAACLVSRTWSGHLEFMRIIKSDAEYSPSYAFWTGIIPGKELF